MSVRGRHWWISFHRNVKSSSAKFQGVNKVTVSFIAYRLGNFQRCHFLKLFIMINATILADQRILVEEILRIFLDIQEQRQIYD